MAQRSTGNLIFIPYYLIMLCFFPPYFLNLHWIAIKSQFELKFKFKLEVCFDVSNDDDEINWYHTMTDSSLLIVKMFQQHQSSLILYTMLRIMC